MIEWRKISYNENLALDWYIIYILPQESGGCSIWYGDEYCIADNFSVQEVIDKLKVSDINIKLPTTEVKTIIENILKENNNELN